MKCVHEKPLANWSTSRHYFHSPCWRRRTASRGCKAQRPTPELVNRIDERNQMEIYISPLSPSESSKKERQKGKINVWRPKIDGEIMCFVYVGVVIVLYVSYLMENLWLRHMASHVRGWKMRRGNCWQDLEMFIIHWKLGRWRHLD